MPVPEDAELIDMEDSEGSYVDSCDEIDPSLKGITMEEGIKIYKKTK